MPTIFIILLLCCGIAKAEEASLVGSRASVEAQQQRAVEYNFTFLIRRAQVWPFIEAGLLQELRGNRDYSLHKDVSYPYVRPATKLFVERLSRQYRAACNEKLVITSALRPTSEQPWNASSKSVHPTGMAVDFRLPPGKCRVWIERVLLALEARGVIEATRERNPPHYHVTVYPLEYTCYARAREGGTCPVLRPD